MTRLCFKGVSVSGFAELVDRYAESPKDIASPSRSTVPLLVWWQECLKDPKLLETTLSHKMTEFECASFEHQVKPLDGKGKASHTDLMLIGNSVKVCVEAKYTESGYDTVGEWMKKGEEENRRLVLKGWLSAIGAVTGRTATPEAVDSIVYQMIHRLASLCVDSSYCGTRPSKRELVYLCFNLDNDKVGYYCAEMKRLLNVVGSNGIDCRMVHLRFNCDKSARYTILQERWVESGKKPMVQTVAAAIKARDLIGFEEPTVFSVGT